MPTSWQQLPQRHRALWEAVKKAALNSPRAVWVPPGPCWAPAPCHTHLGEDPGTKGRLLLTPAQSAGPVSSNCSESVSWRIDSWSPRAGRTWELLVQGSPFQITCKATGTLNREAPLGEMGWRAGRVAAVDGRDKPCAKIPKCNCFSGCKMPHGHGLGWDADFRSPFILNSELALTGLAH